MEGMLEVWGGVRSHSQTVVARLTDCSNEDVNIPSQPSVKLCHDGATALLNKFLVV